MTEHLPRRLSKRLARGGAVLLAVLVTLGLGAAVVGRMTGLPGAAAFRVGSTIVTKDQLRQRMDVLRALYGIRGPVDGPAADRFQRAAAKSVAVGIVLDDAAAARGIAVSDQDARTALNELIARRADPDGHEGFVRLLGTLGTSERDVLDEIARQLREQRLYRQVTDGVAPITDTELRRFYNEHQAVLVWPEHRHLRNIVVADRNQAQQLIDQARGGADFATLVTQFSQDPRTRDTGGDLGAVSRAQLEQGYANAAFAAGPGGYFGPVRTRYGWNVGQLLQVIPARPLGFDEISDELRTRLTEQRKLASWKAWLSDQIRRANVTYAKAYCPAQPNTPPSPLAVEAQGPANHLEDPPR
jgi:peptidyl-prolyl cis-trans isomerase C